MAKNGESVFMLTYLFIRKSQFVKKKSPLWVDVRYQASGL